MAIETVPGSNIIESSAEKKGSREISPYTRNVRGKLQDSLF
jgi:hypothetical protein